MGLAQILRPEMGDLGIRSLTIVGVGIGSPEIVEVGIRSPEIEEMGIRSPFNCRDRLANVLVLGLVFPDV